MAKLKKSIKNLKNKFISKSDHLEYKDGKKKDLEGEDQKQNQKLELQNQIQDHFENLRFKNYILPSDHTQVETKKFFQNAIIHGLATRVGNENYQEDQQKLQKKLDRWKSDLKVQQLPNFCICCGSQVQKEQIDVIKSDTLDLDFLGPGIPLYFGFLKYTAFFLCILILSIGSYNFFSNAFLNGCSDESDEKNGCNKNIISIFSLPNKRFDQKFNELQEILDVFTVAALVIMLQFFRKSQNQIGFQADNLDISESDYAIKIHGLPKYDQALTRQKMYFEFKRMFEPYLDGNKFQIQQINFCYNLDKLNSLQEELQQCIKDYQNELKSYYKQYGDTGVQRKMQNEEYYQKQISEKQQQIHELQNSYNLDERNIENEDPQIRKQFTGVCYVVFQKEQLTLEEGPDPSDVKWENQGERGSKKQLIGYVKSISIELTVLLIGFCCLMYCSQLILSWQIQQDPSLSDICEEKLPESQRLGKEQYHSFVNPSSSLSQSSYIDHDHQKHQQNEFIIKNQDYSNHEDKLECHETETRQQIAVARKLGLTMFFTMGIQTLMIKVVLKWIFSCLQAGRQEVFQNDRNKNQCRLTQNEANQLYENPIYNIAQRYGYLINVMFLTALYAPLLPVCLVISLLGVIFIYWIEKYKILRKSVIQHKIGYNLSTQMTELLEYFLPLYCIADMFFQYLVVITAYKQPVEGQNPLVDIFMQSSLAAKIGVVIGIVNLVLPMEKINQIIFTAPPSFENKHTYDDAKSQFSHTYRALNPITGHSMNQVKQFGDRNV
ncbi:hypothetical protein PPERSA_01075 [Pseudocohnilembus persalinus]|uniref:CSC1/OSCA1-like cytosolic domain-containing protein n=1 Tax=Pseudocohnilembus persalinus TaxID=266149 RepID=A0A0V0QV64_PSEPJ|nr:hypothetical protein PPERSA_01075 [Pseudocohnilembus persalinus]|eukprot:KRX05997.1 hypothetical protein PPERSA_01075 [Pseudocohnilembus persalinus]